MKIKLMAIFIAIFIINSCGSSSSSSSVQKDINSTDSNLTTDIDQIKSTKNSKPSSPSNLEFLDVDTNSFTLSWEKSIDIDGYIDNYYVSFKINNTDWGDARETNSSSMKFNNLNSNFTYQFRVKAKDNTGNYSDYSYSDKFDPTNPPIVINQKPSAVSNILTEANIFDINISFDASIDSDGEVVEYYISYRVKDSDWSYEVATKELSYNIDNLINETTYEIRVRAKDNSGEFGDYALSDETTTLKIPTDTNIVIVHGLNDGASSWGNMAPYISQQMGLKDGSYVEVALKIDIDQEAKCWDGDGKKEILCIDLDDINTQNRFRSLKDIRSQAKDHIYGLDSGDFNITSIDWKLNNDVNVTSDLSTKQEIFLRHRVFAVNFTNENQLSFDAQGVQLKAIIDDIYNVNKIDDFILLSYSMGGLASRAYIQNEQTKNIQKLITLDTPHLGMKNFPLVSEGSYIDFSRNAGVNLAPDSMALSKINSEIGDKYNNISVYHLGYSDEITSDNNYYYNDDGVVDISSQMGVDELNPYRVIFSPTKDDNIMLYQKNNTTLSSISESIKTSNYDTFILSDDLAHIQVLKDNQYLNFILSILPSLENNETTL